MALFYDDVTGEPAMQKKWRPEFQGSKDGDGKRHLP
jgi:hypothetical protein